MASSCSGLWRPDVRCYFKCWLVARIYFSLYRHSRVSTLPSAPVHFTSYPCSQATLSPWQLFTFWRTFKVQKVLVTRYRNQDLTIVWSHCHEHGCTGPASDGLQTKIMTLLALQPPVSIMKNCTGFWFGIQHRTSFHAGCVRWHKGWLRTGEGEKGMRIKDSFQFPSDTSEKNQFSTTVLAYMPYLSGSKDIDCIAQLTLEIKQIIAWSFCSGSNTDYFLQCHTLEYIACLLISNIVSGKKKKKDPLIWLKTNARKK